MGKSIIASIFSIFSADYKDLPSYALKKIKKSEVLLWI